MPDAGLLKTAKQEVAVLHSSGGAAGHRFASFAAGTAAILAGPRNSSPEEKWAGSISGRSCVVSENVVAILCGLVAGEARLVQRLIARFAVREVGVAPAPGRGVLF